MKGRSGIAQSLPYVHLYEDDIRISKILRRLTNETNPSAALELCENLEIAIRSPSNSSYICRSFSFIIEQLIIVLRNCPEKCHTTASICLGWVGYIIRNSFDKFKNCLCKTYHTYDRLQKHIINAFKVTISCDSSTLDLIIHSNDLIEQLKDYLENVDSNDVFIALCDTILEFSKNYKQAFQMNFTDIVDIIVGWHLEVDQPLSIKLHCSMVLQQLSPYFCVELNFTLGLLSQFLEDIVTFGDDVSTTKNSKASLKSNQQKISSFIGAYNSVFKSLFSTQNSTIFLDSFSSLFNNSLIVIAKNAKIVLKTCEELYEETILNINEFICLTFLKEATLHSLSMQNIEDIIKLQLYKAKQFNENQQLSMLYMILMTILKYKTNLPIIFITIIMERENNLLDIIIRKSDSRQYKLLLKIYHNILILKNVPILKESYKHIILDIDRQMKILEMQVKGEITVNSFEITKSQATLEFYLAAISSLAIQTSSIIGMYALNPSILELLITTFKTSNMKLWSQYPTLHNAVLSVLVTHCIKNHNFISTSKLFMEHRFGNPVENNSPTSENYSLILKFLSEIFSSSDRVMTKNLCILLNFTQQLYEESINYASNLKENDYFLNICKNLSIISITLPIETGKCFSILQKYSIIDTNVLNMIRNVSIVQMNSLDPKVRNMYIKIFGKLPLEITLGNMIFYKDINQLDSNKIYELQQWYRSNIQQNSVVINKKCFKTFIDSLNINDKIQNGSELNTLFQNFFNKSWIFHCNYNSNEYYNIANYNAKMCELWLIYEMARYCVSNKLRTSIGKPQETFLGIEAVITMYARAFVRLNSAPMNPKKLRECTELRKNSRYLLDYLENLEKLIYNASEGTAFALTLFDKIASKFFLINNHTCNEWFKRIRTSVNLIALYSWQYESVIRSIERNLKENSLNEVSMDHNMTFLVWSLMNLNEQNTLYGLNVWAKRTFGKRYAWIQYAAEQVSGNKEKAADGYAKYLLENEKTLSDILKKIIFDNLLSCLYYTGQWYRIRDICRRLNKRSITQLDLVDSLVFNDDATEFSDDIDNALKQLTDWSEITNMNTDTSATSLYNNFYCNIMTDISNNYITNVLSSDNCRVSDEIKKVLQLELQDYLRHNNTDTKGDENVSDLIILNHINVCINEGSSNDNCNTILLNNKDGLIPSTLLTKCLLWTEFLERHNQQQLQQTHQKNENTTKHTLYLDIARSARLEGNWYYCQNILKNFFSIKGLNETGEETLNTIAAKMQNPSFHLNIHDKDLLRGFTELTNYVYNYSAMDGINLGSAFCSKICEQQITNNLKEYPEASVKMLLTLAEWLGQRGQGNLTESTYVKILLNQLNNTITNEMLDFESTIIPGNDQVVGKLINCSIQQNPIDGEAWYAFGNWCYRWGKKIMEHKSDVETSSSKNTLSHRDLNMIKDILGDKVTDKIMQQLADILNSHKLHSFDGLDDIDSNNEMNSTELIELELRKIEPFTMISGEKIMNIIKIWRQAYKNEYKYYELATEAYFKYLAIETSHLHNNSNKYANENETGDLHENSQSSSVTITLRLLRLIVKHAIGLQDVLEEGLKTTPLQPWEIIIPQLFSRLNHHEPYVRKSVSELLCRLAKVKPHLIIFPTVVGAHQELKDKNLRSDLNSTMGSEEYEVNKTKTLSTCFNSLLHTLSIQSPERVKHVQLLIKELKRVTLLWEEYWMHSIIQLLNEYSSHFLVFDTEYKKSKNSLTADMIKKYELLLSHFAKDFQTVYDVTNKVPETNYERNFQERFDIHIKNTLQILTKPYDKDNSNEGWNSVKKLYGIFQQQPLRSNSSTIKLLDLSPILANMQNTVISMPGIDAIDNKYIYIKSVDSIVNILPTKTKPKKLSFIGSNGKKYSYLFKGLEDLHLDERIMQFLAISNSMIARSKDFHCNKYHFKAYHYSVIPLGPQSGLISWVDGVTPLFSIYKKWQQRQCVLKEVSPNVTVQNSKVKQQTTNNVTYMRPSDMFYNKLSPLLAEQNMKVSDPRKMWPIDILRRVLKELTDETPNDLLSKEIWCSAVTSESWRKLIRNYIASMAVMSVIGYVIGLGDRHLDNVLIKLSTGEIVHIDYNVCFEKGKTLTVPEKVPFRLTPNLIDALGITGIEGAFRIGCENVLKILRKEKETLLTLLEAFVYDPLVDWQTNDGNKTLPLRLGIGYIKNVNNMTINRNNLHLKSDQKDAHKKNDSCTKEYILGKFNELKPIFEKFSSDVVTKLLDIEHSIKTQLDLRIRLQAAEKHVSGISKCSAIIGELETLGPAIGSHNLNTISQRNQTCKMYINNFETIQVNAISSYEKIETLLNDYIFGIHSEQFQSEQILKQHNYMYPKEKYAFMMGLLHDKLDAHDIKCIEDIYNSDISGVLLCSLEVILQYIDVIKNIPQSRLKNNRLFLIMDLYKQLLKKEQTADHLLLTFNNFIEDDLNCVDLCQSRVIEYSSFMEKIWLELSFKLHNLISELDQQRQQVSSFESIKMSIENFIQLNPEHNFNIISYNMIQLLYKANESFFVYEKASVDKDDYSLLNQQIGFVANVESAIACLPYNKEYDQLDYQLLECLKKSLNSLKNIQNVFDLSLIERIVHLFMINTDMELQKTLETICKSKENIRNSLNANNVRVLSPNHSKLLKILEEIKTNFEYLDQSLEELYRVIIDTVDCVPECEISIFVKSRLINQCNFKEINDSLKYDMALACFKEIEKQIKAFCDNDIQNVFDISVLSSTISFYIDNIEKTFLSGLTSLIVKGFLDNFQNTTILQSSLQEEFVVANNENLITGQILMENTYMKLQLMTTIHSIQHEVQRYTTWTNFYTKIASAYFWLNEKSLYSDELVYSHIIYKEKLLNVIEVQCEDIKQWLDTITDLRIELDNNYNNIIKRLQSHPDFLNIYEDFLYTQQSYLGFMMELASTSTNYIHIVCEFEKSWYPNFTANDQELNSTLNQWSEAKKHLDLSESLMTPEEKSIVELLDPEGKIDQCWINNIGGLLDEMTFTAQKELDDLKCQAKNSEEEIKAENESIQIFLDTDLKSELRYLLKMLLRNHKQLPANIRENSNVPYRIRHCQNNIKIFFTNLISLQQQLQLNSIEILNNNLKEINELYETSEKNCKEFIDIFREFYRSEDDDRIDDIPTIGADMRINPIDKTILTEQKRNVYAVSVWKRIRMKLEGRDPDSNRRSSVMEQIEFIIDEARNTDNLAVLYEGWTPWV